MFNREYGLVHNPGDPERYVRLVRWEDRWVQMDDTWEVRLRVPIVWEWTPLDVGNPRSLNYSGPVWRLVLTRITELPMRSWPVRWPQDAPTETELMRMERIRAVRAACHVDQERAAAEPDWKDTASHSESRTFSDASVAA